MYKIIMELSRWKEKVDRVSLEDDEMEKVVNSFERGRLT